MSIALMVHQYSGYFCIHVDRREQDVKFFNKGITIWEIKNDTYVVSISNHFLQVIYDQGLQQYERLTVQ